MEGREEKRERNVDVLEVHRMVASYAFPAGDPAHDPGTCPNREWNQQPSGSPAGDQSTEPHQPGLLVLLQLNSCVP